MKFYAVILNNEIYCSVRTDEVNSLLASFKIIEIDEKFREIIVTRR